MSGFFKCKLLGCASSLLLKAILCSQRCYSHLKRALVYETVLLQLVKCKYFRRLNGSSFKNHLKSTCSSIVKLLLLTPLCRSITTDKANFFLKAFSKVKLQQLHYNDIQASEVTLITKLSQASPNPSTSQLTQLGEQVGFPSFYLSASCSIYCQHTMSQISHIQGSPVPKFCPLGPGNLSFGQKQLEMTKRCFYPHKLNVNCHFSEGHVLATHLLMPTSP